MQQKLCLAVFVSALFIGSGCSNSGGADSPAVDTQPPAEVKSVSTTTGNGQVLLKWTDPVDNDLSHVDISWTPGGNTSQSVSAGIQSYTVTGLTNLTTYTFTVKSVDKNGNSSNGTAIDAIPTNFDNLYTWGGFTDNKNGTISFTGLNSYAGQNLVFLKCPQGMTYDSATNGCAGTAGTFQYCSTNDNGCDDGTTLNGTGTSQAFTSCDSLNASGYAGKTTWHVPTTDELKVLINCTDKTMPPQGTTCGVGNYTAPAINSLFIGPPTDMEYWTASAAIGVPVAAYIVHFGNGSYHSGGPQKINSVYLRCVAAGP